MFSFAHCLNYLPPSPNSGNLYNFSNAKNVDLSGIQNNSLPKILNKGRILAWDWDWDWLIYALRLYYNMFLVVLDAKHF